MDNGYYLWGTFFVLLETNFFRIFESFTHSSYNQTLVSSYHSHQKIRCIEISIIFIGNSHNTLHSLLPSLREPIESGDLGESGLAAYFGPGCYIKPILLHLAYWTRCWTLQTCLSSGCWLLKTLSIRTPVPFTYNVTDVCYFIGLSDFFNLINKYMD